MRQTYDYWHDNLGSIPQRYRTPHEPSEPILDQPGPIRARPSSVKSICYGQIGTDEGLMPIASTEFENLSSHSWTTPSKDKGRMNVVWKSGFWVQHAYGMEGEENDQLHMCNAYTLGMKHMRPTLDMPRLCLIHDQDGMRVSHRCSKKGSCQSASLHPGEDGTQEPLLVSSKLLA